MNIINLSESRCRSLKAYLGSTTLALVIGSASLFTATQASAHGYVSSPKSRVIQCNENGIENPTHPACIAAKAVGNQGLYTPQEVAVIGVQDNHQDYIPDGKLCSVGRANLAGMDLARTDWPTTPVSPGMREFIWTNTAAHMTTYFRYYITREGHDHTQPLKWSDLDLIHDSGPEPREFISRHNVQLPYRTGRHIIYSIWQRDWVRDAAEGFYQCVDVDFGDGSGQPPSSSSAPSSSSSNSSFDSNTCANLPAWSASITYQPPEQVSQNGRRYAAQWWTQGQSPSENSGEWGVWMDMGECDGGANTSSAASSVSSTTPPASSAGAASSAAPVGNCTSSVYVDGSNYSTGALVQNGGSEYRCTEGGWCTVGGPYAPGQGWAWTNAWSYERSCQ